MLLQLKASLRENSFYGWCHSARKTLGDARTSHMAGLQQASTATLHTNPCHSPSGLVKKGDEEDEKQRN